MTEHQPDPEAPEPYEAAFRQAAEAVDGQVESFLREVDAAAALLVEVLGWPEAGRQALVEGEVRFHSLKLCDLLVARSREAWFHEPWEAAGLARLAVVLAGRLDTSHYGTSLVETARASASPRTWCPSSRLLISIQKLSRPSRCFNVPLRPSR